MRWTAFCFYTLALVMGLWPVVGLLLDPGDKNHLVRLILCPVVALGIAALGKLLSLTCQALSIYVQERQRAG